ncbi:metallophosphoesterase [Vibrio sp. PP-XX7]
MLIAQLTDLHIKRDGKWAYRTIDTLSCLQRAVAHINELSPLPDWVVITGDLADFGERNEYEVLLPELQRLKPKLKIIPGNHDNREHLRHALQGLTDFDHPDYCHFRETVGDYELIGLDTLVPGASFGLLSDASLAWLDQALLDCQFRQAFVFMHHPPMAVGIHHMDVQKLQNDAALAAVLHKYSHAEGIVTGHLHRPHFCHLARVSRCGWGHHIGHAVTLDLSSDAVLVISHRTASDPAVQADI